MKKEVKNPIGEILELPNSEIKVKVVEDIKPSQCSHCYFSESCDSMDDSDVEVFQVLHDLDCNDGYHYEEVKP